MAGHENDWDMNPRGGEMTLAVEAAEAGHAHVKNQTSRPVGLRVLQEFLRRREEPRPQSDRSNQVAQRVANGRIVIDNEDRGGLRIHT